MKNKKAVFLIATLLIIICMLPALFLWHKETGAKYEVICFGDSVMAGYYGADAIPGIMEKKTGRKTLNAAFGGLTMCVPYEAPKAGDASHLFCMTELSKALYERDFSLQIMATNSRTEAIPEAWLIEAQALNSLDYDSVKYVIIEQGVNDYLLGKPIEDASDPYNIYTFAGGLRTSIENVRKALPDAEIILVTPSYMWLATMEEDCTVTDFGGGTLPEYVAREKEIAAEYNLTCVDNFYSSGIDASNYKNYLYDGLHTLEEANNLMADNIIRNVEGLRK